MNAIGTAVEGFVKGIGDAVGNVAKGAADSAKGGLKVIEGALSLNPKEMGKGAVEMLGGDAKAAPAAMELTPEGLEASAANNLLDGAADSLGLGGSNGAHIDVGGVKDMAKLAGALKA
jgi:hypothetical protein